MSKDLEKDELKSSLLDYLGDQECITLAIYWPDDWHELTVDADVWREIASGVKLSEEGENFFYEGVEFACSWHFNRGSPGSLIVTYSSPDGDDGSEGVGYDGSIKDAFVSDMGSATT